MARGFNLLGKPRTNRMLVVSAPTFEELRQRLLDGGYDWTLNERQDMLKMGEFVLVVHEERGDGRP